MLNKNRKSMKNCGLFLNMAKRCFCLFFQVLMLGTMWQIGVLAAERWVFLTKKWPFSAISHYVLSEKFSGRLRPNGWFCSRVVATPKNQEYTGIYSIRRAAAVLTPHTPKSRKMVPNLLRFHIKTPICHIVPRGNL